MGFAVQSRENPTFIMESLFLASLSFCFFLPALLSRETLERDGHVPIVLATCPWDPEHGRRGAGYQPHFMLTLSQQHPGPVQRPPLPCSSSHTAKPCPTMGLWRQQASPTCSDLRPSRCPCFPGLVFPPSELETHQCRGCGLPRRKT